ncbi:MAG: hypothetical protein H6R18_9 [Proteobacteria bacterium]|nr:hypothetical protein [Pseudomonadota bacterium]
MSVYGNNVVPISGAGRGSEPGQRIVRECHDRLGHLVFDWLGSLDEEIAEDLFVLAKDTRDRKAQTHYLDLRTVVQKNWPEFTAAFRKAFHRDHTASSYLSIEISDFSGLELVDDNKLSENILIREFTARIGESCNQELHGLDHRVAALLDSEDVDKIDNPLGSAIVCQALADAAGALCQNSEQRIVLLRQIERRLHPVLPEIYQTINKYLVSLNVLPDLKQNFRRASSQATGTTSQETPKDSLPSLNPQAEIPISGNVLTALQKLVAARSSELAANGESSSSTGNTAAGSPMDAAALSRVFFASLENFMPEKGNSMVNQIHAIRSSEVANQVGHVEAVTIDIVAMLFDFIFNDKNVPNGVKALVGRLQIPVLKVAMLDQGFFGSKSHPARRFLDEISEICLRWGGNIDQEDPFFITLESLIDRIQNEFECDVAVFSRALDELHAFVNTHDSEEDATARIAADVAANRQRETEAWEQASNAVRLACMETMPEVISDFYKEDWVKVLQKIAIAENKDSPPWMDAVKLMSDLAQSVVPKKKPEERMALISSLPTLLSRVNRGLDLVSTDKSTRRPFFDALVALHTAALKGEPSSASFHHHTKKKLEPAPKAEVSNAPVAVAEPHPEGDIIVTRSVANGVEVEEVTLVGAKPVWRADDRDVARQVADLKRGDWVEFHQEDGSISRERLTWISPQRHVLVFSNHRAAKAISIAPDALARMIRENQASLVSDTPIFERAMSGVLDSLNAA